MTTELPVKQTLVEAEPRTPPDAVRVSPSSKTLTLKLSIKRECCVFFVCDYAAPHTMSTFPEHNLEKASVAFSLYVKQHFTRIECSPTQPAERECCVFFVCDFIKQHLTPSRCQSLKHERSVFFVCEAVSSALATVRDTCAVLQEGLRKSLRLWRPWDTVP